MVVLSVLSTTVNCDSADDPFNGTWVMNVAQSRYANADLPRGMVVVMASAGDCVHYRSETTRRDGAITVAEFTAALDGMPAMVTGDAGMLAPVALQRIDANTIEAVYLRGLKPVATSKRVVSRGGAVMTITTTYKDKHGKAAINIGVYDRTPATALQSL